jgi:hypothetical protein
LLLVFMILLFEPTGHAELIYTIGCSYKRSL